MSFLKCCCFSGSASDDETERKQGNSGKQNVGFESEKGNSQTGEKQLDTENAHVVPNLSTDGKPALEEITQIEVDPDGKEDIPDMEH